MTDRRAALLMLSGLLLSLAGSARAAMRTRPINPMNNSYAQAMEVEGASRLLFVSGQVPADAGDHVPATFKEQARLAWRNVEAQLAAAGMNFDNLVKVTIYLSDRAHRQANYEVRHEMLGGRTPALTVVIADIYDEAWLLEIEAIAAAGSGGAR